MEEPTESDDYDFIPPIQRRQANDDDDEIDDDDGAPDPSVLDRAAPVSYTHLTLPTTPYV